MKDRHVLRASAAPCAAASGPPSGPRGSARGRGGLPGAHQRAAPRELRRPHPHPRSVDIRRVRKFCSGATPQPQLQKRRPQAVGGVRCAGRTGVSHGADPEGRRTELGMGRGVGGLAPGARPESLEEGGGRGAGGAAALTRAGPAGPRGLPRAREAPAPRPLHGAPAPPAHAGSGRPDTELMFHVGSGTPRTESPTGDPVTQDEAEGAGVGDTHPAEGLRGRGRNPPPTRLRLLRLRARPAWCRGRESAGPSARLLVCVFVPSRAEGVPSDPLVLGTGSAAPSRDARHQTERFL